MEDNFRNSLIIISGIVIAAIFIHGLWIIRKQKNPYKLKTNKDTIQPLKRDFDGKGFDQDGVGQVKVLKQKNEPDVNSEQDFEQAISLEEISHLEAGQTAGSYTDLNTQEQILDHDSLSEAGEDNVNEQTPLTADEDKAVVEEIILEPIYQQPVTQAKPAGSKPRKAPLRKKVVKDKPAQAPVKRNQMEINFGEGISLDEDNTEHQVSAKVTPVKADQVSSDQASSDQASSDQASSENASTEKVNISSKTVEIQPQIIILSVVMPANQMMSGAALLPSLLTLGMKYGEMDIFHRHQDSAGNGGVSFSLANMMNPGSFDLDTMETFATQGVTLFMALPNAVDAFAAFEQMLAAAKQLATEFNAQILDDKRNRLTKQAEQHYVSKIREFERQYRLASVE